MKIITPNPPKKEHLAKIKKQMEKMGSPTIRMVDRDDHLTAIEGSHRLHAAKDMKVPVIVRLVDPEGFTEKHDYKGLPKKIRVGELAKHSEMSPQSHVTIPDSQLEFKQ